MREAHKHLVEKLGMKDSHFDAVMENLVSTLTELGVPGELISEAAGIAESTRGDVLNKQTRLEATVSLGTPRVVLPWLCFRSSWGYLP